MGQKFSGLKGALSKMENDSAVLKKTAADKDTGSSGQSSAAENAAGEDTSNQLVSPLENLYSSTSALSSAGSAGEEEACSSKSIERRPSSDKHGHRSSALSIMCGRRSRSKSLQTSKEFEKSKKKRHHWVVRFHSALLKNSCRSNSASSSTYDPHVPEASLSESCVCTGFRQTGEQQPAAADDTVTPPSQPEEASAAQEEEMNAFDADPSAKPVIDLSKFNPDDYPIEDCDEVARRGRAREMAEGIEAPANYQPTPQHIQLVCPPNFDIDNLTALFETHLGIYRRAMTGLPPWDVLPMITAPMLSQRVQIHTQIDYIHYLVPDLLEITLSPFYWGKMDRYEADRLLEGRPEGTFLLRDSAQEEYLFSVSFRRYGRSVHARIEEWNHQVSFDAHDPGVFSTTTVCGLIDHYKDPSRCMFFEPALTIPLHRNFPFSLQHLCRAVVSSKSTYDGISKLMLPKALKNYLKEYHYKQRVCVRRLEQ